MKREKRKNKIDVVATKLIIYIHYTLRKKLIYILKML